MNPPVRLNRHHTIHQRVGWRLAHNVPIRDLLSRAPTAQTLRAAWQSLRERNALNDAAPATVRLWQQTIFNRAEELIDAEPLRALGVYNTVFTILDSNTQQLLLDYAKRRQSNALRTQRSAS